MAKKQKTARITPDIAHLLARVCGWTDESFVAIRSKNAWEGFNAGKNKIAMRQRGVPYSSGGGGDAARQSASRTLREAESEGFIIAERSEGAARAAYVKLTDRGDHVARQLCGHPSVMDAHHLCRRIAELQDRHTGWGVGVHCGKVLVNECVVADVDPNQIYSTATVENRLPAITIEEEALPALCRGWLVAHSDFFGRCWYELTAIGREVIAALPSASPDDFVYDNKILGTWCEARTSARAFIQHHEEDGMELGLIPISCSIAPLRSDRMEAAAR